MRIIVALAIAFGLLASGQHLNAQHICDKQPCNCLVEVAAVVGGPQASEDFSYSDDGESVTDDDFIARLLAGGEIGSAGGFEYKALNGGEYIDSAVIANRLRFRFDAGYDNPFPDRAEFFYAQCGCFPGAPGPGSDAPLTLATSVDYQEFTGYLEHVFSNRLSAFVEMPFRLLNPELDPAVAAMPGALTIDNTGGLGDINAGFRYGIAQCDDYDITFQLRIYTPTGDADRGLGTAHVSIEPSILAQRELSDRLTTFGEFRIWAPISDSQFMGQDFAGTVLRYGAGASYLLSESCYKGRPSRLDGVLEFVGWSVLDGLKFNPLTGPLPADDTIVNVKVGGRWTVDNHSFSVSYGKALTQEVWYDQILRAQYTMLY